MESRNQICLSCKQFGLCIVHWGTDCKRWGGKKIPRMKSVSKEPKCQEDTPTKLKKRDRLEKSDQLMKMFEQVKTKVMNW